MINNQELLVHFVFIVQTLEYYKNVYFKKYYSHTKVRMKNVFVYILLKNNSLQLVLYFTNKT